MKISALNENYRQMASPASTRASFKGKYQLNRELTKKIADHSDGFVKFLTKLGKNNGEILNTVVTAIGTAFVAPIFIAFNPISKEDKETKIYSALRQPISAVIAVAIQIGVNTKFNNWMNKLASTGQLDRANLVAKPQNSYLKQILKLEKPNLSKDDIAKNIEKKQDGAFWREVENLRVKLKNEKIDYKDLIDPSTYKDAKSQVEKEIKAHGEALRQKVGKSAKEVEELKNLDGLSKNELKHLVDDRTVKRATEIVQSQMKQEAKIKLRIGRLAASGKSFEQVLAELNAQNEGIKKRIVKSDGKAKSILENSSKQLKDVIDKLEGAGGFDKVKNVGKNYKEVLQSVKIKKLVKVGINNSEEVLKSSKKWGGIVLSLATLPVSCGILNWAYPRIMEKVMPEVSHAKKAKEAK